MNFNTLHFVKSEIENSIQAKKNIFSNEKMLTNIAEVTDVVIQAYRNHHKLLLAGNGGSAADAQHIAAEFVSRFYFDRPGLSAFALSSDPSVVTAIANDYGYENLFARQIQAHGQKGDLFFAISTSGKSPNILKAIQTAKSQGLITVALTGVNGVEMAQMCDHAIAVDSAVTPKIQESHITIGHAICAGVEAALFKNPNEKK